MGLIEVSDLDDPRLADYRDIRDRQLRGHHAYGGLFVGEQPLVVQRMLARPGVTKSVLLTPNWIDGVGSHAPAEVPVYVASSDLISGVAGFDVHRGVLAMGHRSAVERTDLDADLLSRDRVTLVLCEDISNIDNIGLLFRNAAAFGVDGVLLSRSCHDPLYRKSLRVSIGHALDVPFARSRDWATDLDRLREHLTLIAAAPVEGAVDLDQVDRPARLGLVVGHEYGGVSSETLARCHTIVKIPMAPGVDSLNVAVATAVCLHRLSTGIRE